MATQTTNSDVTAPAVTIVSPAYNATVSGIVAVDVDASDSNGVSEVVLYANGQAIGTDRTAPYQFSWDSSGVADGDAVLTAYAYDAAGNTGISSGVAVVVDNQQETVDSTPPSVSILTPVAGNTVVSGNVSVAVDATDDTGVTKVVLYVNGQSVGTDQSAPFNFNWDSTQRADGNVTMTARAYDAANNSSLSAGVTVTVDNVPDVADSTPPTVAITNLSNGSTVSGNVSINVRARDDVGVTLLSVYVDNSLECSIADSDSLSCNWNTRKLSGSHTIRAVARDAAGHSGDATISVSVTSSSNGNSNKGRGNNK
jgi:hypothetical protein